MKERSLVVQVDGARRCREQHHPVPWAVEPRAQPLLREIVLEKLGDHVEDLVSLFNAVMVVVRLKMVYVYAQQAERVPFGEAVEEFLFALGMPEQS